MFIFLELSKYLPKNTQGWRWWNHYFKRKTVLKAQNESDHDSYVLWGQASLD